jgi:uracil-DNA glycosylase
MLDFGQTKDDWLPLFETVSITPEWVGLERFVDEERSKADVYPDPSDVFRAFIETALRDVRVVIVGQDPYHDFGQAHGLAFSVKKGVAKPPSLRNILQELDSDIGTGPQVSGDLTPWAKQGVLLLNSVLTVRAKAPGSHQKHGWEQVTDCLLREISRQRDPVAFVLWGASAINKADLIDTDRHKIVSSVHPSPFSAYRGFFGSKPFSQVNNFLASHHRPVIDWRLCYE